METDFYAAFCQGTYHMKIIACTLSVSWTTKTWKRPLQNTI